MIEVYEKLYQDTTHIAQVGLTLNRYLLASDPAILFNAGSDFCAAELLAQVQEILGERPLKYVFVSHVDNDVCDGLGLFYRAYPDLVAITGQLAARDLSGYGFGGKIIEAQGGETFQDGELKLSFYNFPYDIGMHNGLIAHEQKTGILYAANLFKRGGFNAGLVLNAAWVDLLLEIRAERIPDKEVRDAFKQSILGIAPRFVASSSGCCYKVIM